MISVFDPGWVDAMLRIIGERAREEAEKANLDEAKRIDSLEPPKESD